MIILFVNYIYFHMILFNGDDKYLHNCHMFIYL